MLPVLQTQDISQYEFEEFCEKWVFHFYEKTKGGNAFSDDQYDEFWEDFEKINPSIWVTYTYITSLKTKVTFFPSSGDKYETFFTFNTRQVI